MLKKTIIFVYVVLKYYQRHQEGPRRRVRQVNLIFKQCKGSSQFTSTQIRRCTLFKFTIRFVWLTFNSVVDKRSSQMRLIYTKKNAYLLVYSFDYIWGGGSLYFWPKSQKQARIESDNWAYIGEYESVLTSFLNKLY